MKRVKAGIVGAGFMGMVHAEALRRLGNVDILAVANPEIGIAKDFAEQNNIQSFTADYRDLIENPDIDVIHNCTPNFLHYGINKEVILAGKHIVSEKPLTLSAAEAEELVQLVESRKVIGAVNHIYRFFPLVQQMRAMVKERGIGDLYQVRGSYLQDWLLHDTDYNWRIEPAIGGKSRALADIGTHWCDLVEHITGKRIARVFANLQTLIPKRKKPAVSGRTFEQTNGAGGYEEVEVRTEDCASVLFYLDDGTLGSFSVSQLSAGRKNCLTVEIDGSKQSLSWNQEKPNKLLIGNRDVPNQELLRDASLTDGPTHPFISYPGGHNEGYADAQKNALSHIYAAIRGEVTSDYLFATFRDAWHQMQLVEGMLASDKSQQWVKID